MQAVMCMAGLMMLVLSHKATQLLPAVQKEERRNSELQHPGGTLYTGVFFFFPSPLNVVLERLNHVYVCCTKSGSADLEDAY